MGIQIRGIFGGMLSLSCYMRLGGARQACGLPILFVVVACFHYACLESAASVLPLDCDPVWLLWRGNVGVGRMVCGWPSLVRVAKLAYCPRDPISIVPLMSAALNTTSSQESFWNASHLATQTSDRTRIGAHRFEKEGRRGCVLGCGGNRRVFVARRRSANQSILGKQGRRSLVGFWFYGSRGFLGGIVGNQGKRICLMSQSHDGDCSAGF